MIQSSKFNWSTVKDEPCAMPTATTTVNLGYSCQAVLTRVGNLVIAHEVHYVTQTVPRMQNAVMSQTIPDGYRPVTGQWGHITGTLACDPGGEWYSGLGWAISPDGTIKMSVSASFITGGIVSLSGVWVTDNAWPS